MDEDFEKDPLMVDTRRLIAKLAEELRIVRKQRRGQSGDAANLTKLLRTRFQAAKLFDVQIGWLVAVTKCIHGENDDAPVYWPAVEAAELAILPIVVR